MTDSETTYLLARAQDEAIAAIRADNPAAAAAHQRLSLLYSAKAIIELGHDEEDHPVAARPIPIAAAWR